MICAKRRRIAAAVSRSLVVSLRISKLLLRPVDREREDSPAASALPISRAQLERSSIVRRACGRFSSMRPRKSARPHSGNIKREDRYAPPDFSERIRSPRAAAAASIRLRQNCLPWTLSISERRGRKPTTAASASTHRRTDTCRAATYHPTAIGSCVTLLARRSSAVVRRPGHLRSELSVREISIGDPEAPSPKFFAGVSSLPWAQQKKRYRDERSPDAARISTLPA